MAVVGEVVAGRFCLVRAIGVGGMGAVWQARDEVLARDVALKEIVPLPALSPGRTDIWAQTVREARTSARLNHPNVVRVFDVLFTAGRPWIVMEYVPGRSLYAVVQEDGPVSTDHAARIGLAVLDGLVAVHQAGVLHRDVKPHNVLLADDGRILLADFGVAMFHGDLADDVILGSPGYVAPERVREGASTVQTDLWSLGATLYWMLEGKPPQSRIRSGRLAKVVNGLLHHDPAQRPTAEATRSLLSRARPMRLPMRLPLRKTAVATTAAALVATAGTVAWAAFAPAGGDGRTVPTALSCATAADPQVTSSGAPPKASTPVKDSGESTALPSGWVRARDIGFSISVPEGWRRSTDGTAVCLLDPTGQRAVAVAAGAPADPDRVAFWQHAEGDLLSGHGPSGYQRVDISPALYQKGGADWEYRYDAEGVRWHVLRRAFAAGNGKAFVISWTTRDDQWDSSQRDFRTVMQSFEGR
jgi:serine/threonine protein kinase